MPERNERAAAEVIAAEPTAVVATAPAKEQAAARPEPRLPLPPRPQLIAYAVIWLAIVAAVAVLTAGR